MQINQIVRDILSEEAVELLDALAAHAVIAAPEQRSSVFYFPVETDNWNSTILLVHEIFDAELLISGNNDWLTFRILQSFGIKDGQLAYQFTPVFAETLS